MSARVGWILSGLAIAFLIFDGGIKLTGSALVSDSFTQLGYPVGLAPAIGVLELALVALYAVPRTSVLGAILLTGLLGGAIASHLRIGSPLPTHTLFGVYLGSVIWAASSCATHACARCCFTAPARRSARRRDGVVRGPRRRLPIEVRRVVRTAPPPRASTRRRWRRGA